MFNNKKVNLNLQQNYTLWKHKSYINRIFQNKTLQHWVHKRSASNGSFQLVVPEKRHRIDNKGV